MLGLLEFGHWFWPSHKTPDDEMRKMTLRAEKLNQLQRPKVLGLIVAAALWALVLDVIMMGYLRLAISSQPLSYFSSLLLLLNATCMLGLLVRARNHAQAYSAGLLLIQCLAILSFSLSVLSLIMISALNNTFLMLAGSAVVIALSISIVDVFSKSIKKFQSQIVEFQNA